LQARLHRLYLMAMAGSTMRSARYDDLSDAECGPRAPPAKGNCGNHPPCYVAWVNESRPDLFALIERIGRLVAVPERGGLSGSEASVLRYLALANRFSHRSIDIANYLGMSRETARKTLRSLGAKGLITGLDATLTPEGARLAGDQSLGALAAEALSPREAAILAEGLTKTLRAVLMRRGQRSFGICSTCRHHGASANGAYCNLVKVDLTVTDIDKMCREHETAPL
jgi:Mn-dependent DtxR family transcriptional regulator